jgi:alkylation response protein AidB-like acyl-CoA dehydrogenase
MELALTPAELHFQHEVRDFFARDYPPALLAKVRRGQRLTRDDQILSQQALRARGWLAASWPKEFGGPGWTPVSRYLFDAELERAGAPDVIPMAVTYVGPVIIHFGTAEQQSRWLPDILSSRALWAQGYSEPEAGSDLASLALSARREADRYVLTGTKIWTTQAHWADWIFCLARTASEVRKQDGISFICVDMRSPGIAVHPIITMNGAWELNRVTFDEVQVPIANRIGEEGRGWYYANVLLQNERLSYTHVGRKKADLLRIRQTAARLPAPGRRCLLEDPLFAARLSTLEIEVAALEIFVLRALVAEAEAAMISALKTRCTQCAQQVTELSLELVSRNMAAYPPRDADDWQRALPVAPAQGPVSADAYLFERAQSIYGGTSEIQKNLIWRALSR